MSTHVHRTSAFAAVAAALVTASAIASATAGCSSETNSSQGSASNDLADIPPNLGFGDKSHLWIDRDISPKFNFRVDATPSPCEEQTGYSADYDDQVRDDFAFGHEYTQMTNDWRASFGVIPTVRPGLSSCVYTLTYADSMHRVVYQDYFTSCSGSFMTGMDIAPYSGEDRSTRSPPRNPPTCP